MRKAVGSICLMTLFAAAVLILGPSCKAEDPPPDVKSEIRFSDVGVPDSVGEAVNLAKKADVIIAVLGQKKDADTQVILVKDRWVEICPQYNCDGDEIRWRIVGRPLEADETMVIRDADPANHCFPNVPVTISFPNNVALSGLPLSNCVTGPDHQWRYVVELYKAGIQNPIASTDPGAIIHP